jgi:hypothetical protein
MTGHKKAQLTATSLNDAIKRMAREQIDAQQCKQPRTPGLLKGELGDAFFEPLPEEENEVPDPPDNEQNQTLVLNQEDSEALIKALLNPPSPNEALLAAAALYRQTISA